MIEKIRSGGRTEADQAGLDAAIEIGIPHRGWVPWCGKTEAGRLSESHRRREVSSDRYPRRTRHHAYFWDTLASSKVAISARIFADPSTRIMASAAPVPSPSRMSRQRRGARPM
jgi:hypothetical protein